MTQPTIPTRQTVLNRWHRENGAKMVDFEGWDMPVQYPSGIIGEHLATRRHAGLFDVSHMGRFRISGPGAEAFLHRTLTNSARALRPGQAQYTFIANESGGAVDDAYLYRLGQTEFLLVVNASNRRKDWEWLFESGPGAGAAAQGNRLDAEDVSESLAMISLQGPASASVLESVLPAAALPENKRNCLNVVPLEGQRLIVARTGYTGETGCFELFPAREAAVSLWERLIESGAIAVGLGARDSLRLEAGLPLYGHELGIDIDGAEIPIFANSLASFSVRVDDEEPYLGQAALARQRCELVALRRGEPLPGGAKALQRLVQPIAVFSGRKPLRAGHRVFLDGRPVGYVTSGTSVPYSHFYGRGITAVPSAEHELRPIGLALLESSIRYRTDRSIVFQVTDERGRSQDAELVERNLWPAAPFARAYRGFRPRAPGPSLGELSPRELATRSERLSEEAAHNTAWRRRECVNLIPSEQVTSAFVDALTIADPSGRYNEHNALKSLGPEAPDVCYYKGTDFIMEKEQELKAALRAFFGCAQVEPRVISGQMANDVVYDACKQFHNRFRRGRDPSLLAPVLVHDLNKGGHLSAQVPGALKNYVGIDPRTERAAVLHFPFDAANPHRIDIEATKVLIGEHRPQLIVFGRSVIIHREPVREIAEYVHREWGADNPQRPFILYDGAHVLGLLGPAFQAPLEEGADVVTGSTHKSFFGPQRGVILSNIRPGSAFESLWASIEARTFPGHVSNHHLGTLLGLLGATYEMLAFRDEYPTQVIRNAKALATGLARAGLSVEGDPTVDFTETHQVLLRGARASGERLATALESNHIITNPQAYYDDPSFAAASGVRMGTQEMTRYGMQEADFGELATLIAKIVSDPTPGSSREDVNALRRRFVEMRYCFGP